MALAPILGAAEISTRMTVDEVRRVISEAVLGFRGPRPGTPGWLQFHLGSAVWVRLWGLWTPKAYTRLPFVVDAEVVDLGEERTVRLAFRSSEGWYLVRLPRVEPAYRRRFAEITYAVETRLR